jgi:hypothetical protein
MSKKERWFPGPEYDYFYDAPSYATSVIGELSYLEEEDEDVLTAARKLNQREQAKAVMLERQLSKSERKRRQHTGVFGRPRTP